MINVMSEKEKVVKNHFLDILLTREKENERCK